MATITLPLDRSRYSKQCHYCKLLKTKSDYYTRMISYNSKNPRQLWNCINKILHRLPAPSLPKHVSLAAFTPATVGEVRKIIMSSPNKSRDLGPLPTTLLKACLDALVSPITNIIKTLLCSGMFPDDFKQAHVSPLLKKSSLLKDDLNSYRPISNLSFISKILERVATSRLRSHIRLNGLFNVSQSAYKQFHSTRTALLKVYNDVTLNMDKGKLTALTLLDLSAAFDNSDHTILSKRLSLWYGVSVFVIWCICLCGMVYLAQH